MEEIGGVLRDSVSDCPGLVYGQAQDAGVSAAADDLQGRSGKTRPEAGETVKE